MDIWGAVVVALVVEGTMNTEDAVGLSFRWVEGSVYDALHSLREVFFKRAPG